MCSQQHNLYMVKHRKEKSMLQLLALFLLVIFLTALSGFWLGYFLGKTITLNQVSDKLDTLITETLDEHYHDDNSDIVKNLTDIINQITLDKTKDFTYNNISNRIKRKDISSEISERTIE